MTNSAVKEASSHYQLSTVNSQFANEVKQVPVGYKQTEVGVIPKDWTVKSLGSITDPNRPISYGIVQTGPNVPNGIRCLRVVDIVGGKINTNNLITTSKSISDSYRRTILKIGDLVIPLRGKVGEIGLIDNELCGANLTRGIALIALYDGVDPRYLKNYLSSSHSSNRFLASMNGSALQEITIASLRNFKVSIPVSQKEQTAIAKALSDVDALIQELEKLIAKKQSIKTATMQQLLTGRTRVQWKIENGELKIIPPDHSQLTKQSELGEIPEDWEVYSLAQLIKNTQLGGNYRNSEQGTGQPLIKMGNLGRGYIKLDKLEFVVGKVNEVDRLEFGDLLFNTRNTLELVGKVAAWRNELPVAYFNSNLMRITFDSVVVGCNFYMNAVMNSEGFVSALSDIAIGTTSVAAIYTRDLFQLKIALPSKKEQTAIATILSDMDEEIQALERRLNKTRQIKQGMMQELLTGKTRLINGELTMENGK